MKIPTIVKWPGGKKRLLSQIDPYLPDKVDRYFEPFIGGAAMFFYIKQKYNPKFCMISDINEDLINTFMDVRDNLLELIKHLKYFQKNNSEEFYYKTRKLYNDMKLEGIKRSAAFIYFSKTSFNGVYRVNKKGEYNVPYGYYKDRKIYLKEDIMLASQLLQGVIIKKQDYQLIAPLVKEGDLVYLDPCYDPLKRTSFVHYTPERLQKEDRINLFNFIQLLRSKKAKVMLSNNRLEEVETIYRKAGYVINQIEASRTVNCKPDGRGRIAELLLTNFS